MWLVTLNLELLNDSNSITFNFILRACFYNLSPATGRKYPRSGLKLPHCAPNTRYIIIITVILSSLFELF